ncbi:MAG: aminoacyl-tRNA hydrolase [Deltaproteobacteria bacterium]|nr:aminoacyl-tRNA hydrolase [Deltaproteobacteria bacterium]
MHLIVGLGNPGNGYRNTRHNIGFMLVDRLSLAHGFRLVNQSCGAVWAAGMIRGVEAALAKPDTYMNLSGKAVCALKDALSIPLEYIIVAHDDCDLPLGRLRIRTAGGSGGHKGVESIIAGLGTNGFPRLRLGIGRPDGQETDEYVLSRFRPADKGHVEDMLDRAASAVEAMLTEGITVSMNRYNAA